MIRNSSMSKAFSSDSDIGIIITTERIASLIHEEMERYVFGYTFPLIIEIPDRKGPLGDRISIRQMVRSAVGVNV